MPILLFVIVSLLLNGAVLAETKEKDDIEKLKEGAQAFQEKRPPNLILPIIALDLDEVKIHLTYPTDYPSMVGRCSSPLSFDLTDEVKALNDHLDEICEVLADLASAYRFWPKPRSYSVSIALRSPVKKTTHVSAAFHSLSEATQFLDHLRAHAIRSLTVRPGTYNYSTKEFVACEFCSITGVTFSAEPSSPWQSPVYHTCHDGDTCTFSFPGLPDVFGKEVAVRLAGIDTPELPGRCEREHTLATQARDFVRDRLGQATTITLKQIERGKYFRLLAAIEVDGEDLGTQLLAKGMAHPYEGQGSKPNWCAEEE
jgi:endonuclease YncB( thermonuclease family)